jgi:hypothetical protein
MSATVPPSYARVQDYHHCCPDHGVVQLQKIITVDGRVWPALAQTIPPESLGKCPHNSTRVGRVGDAKATGCPGRMTVALYSSMDYVTYMALHRGEPDREVEA